MKRLSVHIILIFIYLGLLSAGIEKSSAQDTVQAVIVFDCVPTFEQTPLFKYDRIYAYSSFPDTAGANKGEVVYDYNDTTILLLTGSIDMDMDSLGQNLKFVLLRNSPSCYTSYVTTFVTDEQRNNSDSLFITSFDVSQYSVTYPLDTVCKNESTIQPVINQQIPEISYLSDSGLFIDENGNISPSLSADGIHTIHFETDYCMLEDSAQINIIGDKEFGLVDSLKICEGSTEIALSDGWSYVNTANPEEYLDTSVGSTIESTYYRAIDNNGCLSSDSVYIEYILSPDIEVSKTEECNSVIVKIEPIGRNLSSIDWSNSMTSNTIEVFESQILQVQVEDEYGCINTQNVDVEVKPYKLESVDYIKEESECWYDGKVEVQSAEVNNSHGNSRFELKNILTDQVITNLNSIPEGVYEIEAVDDRNCRSALTQPVTIYQKCLENYPVITPNNDGDEDEYFIPYNGTIQIFDRNGTLVNEIETPAYWNGRSFDGRILPMGNYVMVADNGRAVNITLIK